MKQVMQYLFELLPNTLIVWSQVLPRLKWSPSNDVYAMERSRLRLNSAVAKSVLERVGVEGAYIKYPGIDMSAVNMFDADGVHLSRVGNDVFLNTITGALETFITTGQRVYPN